MGSIRPQCFGCLDQTFSHVRSLCFEKRRTHLRTSESETISLAKSFQSPPPRSARWSGETWCHPHPLLMLSSYLLFFSPQTLSQSPCHSALATSPSQRGISPSTTARLWSTCLAACRELPLLIYQLCSPVSSRSALLPADLIIKYYPLPDTVHISQNKYIYIIIVCPWSLQALDSCPLVSRSSLSISAFAHQLCSLSMGLTVTTELYWKISIIWEVNNTLPHDFHIFILNVFHWGLLLQLFQVKIGWSLHKLWLS